MTTIPFHPLSQEAAHAVAIDEALKLHPADSGRFNERESFYITRRAELLAGGYTLRDHFAANAPPIPDDFRAWAGAAPADAGAERLVRWRWHYADLMLAARAPLTPTTPGAPA